MKARTFATLYRGRSWSARRKLERRTCRSSLLKKSSDSLVSGLDTDGSLDELPGSLLEDEVRSLGTVVDEGDARES